MIDLTQVLTFSEAAEKWGLANGNTLRKAVERKRFHSDEIRKSGDVWLTTYQAMLRVFGQPRQSELFQWNRCINWYQRLYIKTKKPKKSCRLFLIRLMKQ